MLKRTLTAATLVMATALPATAGGTLSLSLNARGGEAADAIHAGLLIYRLLQGADGDAHVEQNGARNGAAISQRAGRGALGVIHQDGNGHEAILDQRGRGQAHGIFQFGDGARAQVVQRRHGQTGLTFQFGFD